LASLGVSQAAGTVPDVPGGLPASGSAAVEVDACKGGDLTAKEEQQRRRDLHAFNECFVAQYYVVRRVGLVVLQEGSLPVVSSVLSR
jgi:hypothetical protein